jgi:hypothetical protein
MSDDTAMTRGQRIQARLRVTHPWTILAVGLLLSLVIKYVFIVASSAIELTWRDTNVEGSVVALLFSPPQFW